MSNNKVTCKDVANHICESLGEDLNSARCREIKEHLESCSDCREYFSSVEKTIGFYKTYNVDLPGEVHKRLMDCLDLPDEE